MTNGKKFAIGIIVAIVAIILWGVGAYNSFVRSEENIKNQFAQIDVQYQRRFDLIPNLVEAVKGSLKQEQAVFLGIADARTKYAGTQVGTPERVGAINGLESAVGRLLVVMENYPQLLSNENIARLMDELAGTENRFAIERKRYNDLVNEYNKMVRVFPGSSVAKMRGFAQKDLLNVPEQTKVVPQVKLNVE